MDAAVDLALEEAGGFEDAQMFGNGGQRNAKGFRQFSDRGFSLAQAGQDGAARGIGKRAEGGVQERR